MQHAAQDYFDSNFCIHIGHKSKQTVSLIYGGDIDSGPLWNSLQLILSKIGSLLDVEAGILFRSKSCSLRNCHIQQVGEQNYNDLQICNILCCNNDIFSNFYLHETFSLSCLLTSFPGYF